MSQTTAIVDYGSGNLHSAAKAVERAARDNAIASTVAVTSNPDHVLRADRIILPGVGAFAACRAGLERIPEMLPALHEAVIARKRPFLGICVGMQLMATTGLEFGQTPGFNWIPGEVQPLEPDDRTLKIPHMGWNTLESQAAHPLLDGLALGPDGLHAYFVHSFQFVPDAPTHIMATTSYGGQVTAMVGRDNMAGTQFHPEKSQKLGLYLLANFLRWSP